MQKIFSIIRFAASFAFFGIISISQASADIAKPGGIELNIWGVSKHLESPPQGRQWNESNPGVGMRMYFHSPVSVDGLETFVEADYMARNSTGGQFFMAGVGMQYPVATIAGAKLFVGASGGVSSYNNEWEGRTLTSLAGYPFMAVRYRNITLTGGYIPKVRVSGMSSYPTVFFFLGIRM